jgi:hypothetical protein
MATGYRFRAWLAKRVGGWPVAAASVAWALAACVYAQEEGIPTLRVYANLLQIPTLVLSSQQRPMPPIGERKFFVSIDGGPRFRVTHVRVESDDAIALSVLLDVNHIPSNVMSKVQDAVAGLVPKSLHPIDAVSIYTLDCQLARSIAEPPTTAAALAMTAGLALKPWTAGGKGHGKEACRNRWYLLDSMLSTARGMETQPGRRVMLVITDGADRGSKARWDEVRSAAQEKGVAIFGIVPAPEAVMPFRTSRGAVLGVQAPRAVTDFASLCESTGGMILDNTSGSLAGKLRDFVLLVRGRYIVEFPRPATGPGAHNLDISIEKLTAFIRPAGLSVPLPDPDVAKDPTNILPDPANAPEVGTKRPKP